MRTLAFSDLKNFGNSGKSPNESLSSGKKEENKAEGYDSDGYNTSAIEAKVAEMMNSPINIELDTITGKNFARPPMPEAARLSNLTPVSNNKPASIIKEEISRKSKSSRESTGHAARCNSEKNLRVTSKKQTEMTDPDEYRDDVLDVLSDGDNESPILKSNS